MDFTFITGSFFDDILVGSFFNDVLIGFGGNDFLVGFGGDDLLNGGAGDDTLVGGTGNNFLDGGEGNDTVTYDFFSGNVNANLATGEVTFPGNSTRTDETITNVENLVGMKP